MLAFLAADELFRRRGDGARRERLRRLLLQVALVGVVGEPIVQRDEHARQELRRL